MLSTTIHDRSMRLDMLSPTNEDHRSADIERMS
jgi:hypothetical protein